MSKMESSGLFNCAIRVKDEPCDTSLIENDDNGIDEAPDVKNFRVSREYSTFQDSDKNDENKFDEMQILFE
uniref:Uncharacterized protein n=1 Tax=Trichogramma kaykai TaxID=54128 RepID=A0ABD2WH22_9HYME